MVTIRSRDEIAGLQRAGELVARAFGMLRDRISPGVRLDEIDRAVGDFLLSHGAESPYRGYRPSPAVPPFPATICASVNEEVVHGIPSRRRLREGDLIGIDVGTVLDGWVGDACYTYPVGEVSPCAARLLEVARECLEAGVAEVRPGGRLGDVGAAIQELAEYRGYAVVRELGGHGVGRKLHEEPHVNHSGRRGCGLRLKEGMVFTVEPMINEGGAEIRLQRDGWTVVTADGGLSAQYEHTVAVTGKGCEILTPWHRYMAESTASA